VINDGRHRGGLFVGILITVIGVIFLLDQMEIVHAAWVFEVFWPVILIALGMTMIFRTTNFSGSSVANSSGAANPGQPNATPLADNLPQARTATINFWGPVLIVVGGLWLVSNITGFDAGRLWPLWIIGVGVWLLISRDYMRGYPSRAQRRAWRHYRRYGWPPPSGGPGSGAAPGSGPSATSAGFARQGSGGQEHWANERGEWGVRPQAPVNPAPSGAPCTSGDAASNAPHESGTTAANSFTSPDDVFEHSIAFMAFKRRITTQHFRYAKLSAVFGGFHLDFTMADMEGNQAVMQIDAVFGGGEVRVPPSWRVSIDAHAFGGAFMDETYARPDTTAPTKTLIIRGSTVFGGVVIKN
jgi:LiaI-LiaF-like transmembrane region